MGCSNSTEEAQDALLVDDEDRGTTPSGLGLDGVWTLHLQNDENVVVEINDEIVSFRDVTIPVDFCERELRAEGEGIYTAFIRIVAYIPDVEWGNGEAILEKIELCARCENTAAPLGFMNLQDEINVVYMRDNNPPYETKATRNYSSKSKAKRLSESASFKHGGGSKGSSRDGSPRGGLYGGGMAETECAVCFEDFDDANHMAMVTPCRHVWCSGCIIAVLSVTPPNDKGACPTCRTEVRLEDVKRRASSQSQPSAPPSKNQT